MKVRMTAQLTGSRNGSAWPPAGEILDVHESEALRLIRRGFAEKAGKVADPESDPETYVAEVAPKATKKAASKK